MTGSKRATSSPKASTSKISKAQHQSPRVSTRIAEAKLLKEAQRESQLFSKLCKTSQTPSPGEWITKDGVLFFEASLTPFVYPHNPESSDEYGMPDVTWHFLCDFYRHHAIVNQVISRIEHELCFEDKVDKEYVAMADRAFEEVNRLFRENTSAFGPQMDGMMNKYFHGYPILAARKADMADLGFEWPARWRWPWCAPP